MPAWTRVLPPSLFGRLMLVLGAGLMLAQLLSAAINVAERDQLVAGGWGQQPAQRIADVVELLDQLPAAGRERVLSVFAAPPLVLSLNNKPGITAGDRVMPGRGAAFVTRLRMALGEGREALVEMRPGFAPGLDVGSRAHMRRMDDEHSGRRREGQGAADSAAGTHLMPGPAMVRRGENTHAEMATGAALPVLRVEVLLQDGRWARFDTELPAGPDTLPWRLVASLGVLLLSMLALSWLAVRWVVRPLHVLAQAAQGLGEDLARAPLPETGPREVRQAAHAFNTMQQRLAQFINERTRMLTALSHDLKTPLTRLRLRTALLDDEDTRQRYDADLQEMETMVQQTLDFMRGLGGHEPAQAVDVDAVLAGLCDEHRAMGRDVKVEGRCQGRWHGVPSLFKRAVVNLVDNAVLYGGSATVRIEDSPQQLVLRILDNGPGMPPRELERVFEPFHRLEASRNRATGGTGLGLGIARSVARLHGGDVVLHNRATGGLEAVLSLPHRPPKNPAAASA